MGEGGPGRPIAELSLKRRQTSSKHFAKPKTVQQVGRARPDYITMPESLPNKPPCLANEIMLMAWITTCLQATSNLSWLLIALGKSAAYMQRQQLQDQLPKTFSLLNPPPETHIPSKTVDRQQKTWKPLENVLLPVWLPLEPSFSMAVCCTFVL